jgi:hypothetical protein
MNSFNWVSENILSKLTEVGEGSPRAASAFEGMMMERVVAHDNDQMNDYSRSYWENALNQGEQQSKVAYAECQKMGPPRFTSEP